MIDSIAPHRKSEAPCATPSADRIIQDFRYRPELDGLRALAILPVILFHLHPQWLPGGFLGVDVFFVLSGFLITSSILPRMSDGTAKNAFSFRDFYIRRVKRLLPAILTLILVVQCFGSLILLNSEWLSLSAQAGSVIGVVSNFFSGSKRATIGVRRLKPCRSFTPGL